MKTKNKIFNMAKREFKNTNSEQNSLKRIKEKLQKIIETSTFHGFPSIVRNKRKPIKILWVCLTFFSIIASIYFVIISVLGYLDFEVITRIETFNERPIQFPTVSICASNSSEWKNKTMKEIFNNCDFDGSTSCLLKSNEYFKEYNDIQYGTCYIFNSGKNMNGSQTDILNNYVGGLSNGLKISMKNTSTSSLIVNIYNHSTIVYQNEAFNTYNDNIYMPNGFRTYVKLKKIFDQKLSLPYNDCIKDITLFPLNKTIIELITQNDKTYDQQACFRMCFKYSLFTEKSCNCTPSTAENSWQDCYLNGNKEKKICIKNVREEFNEKIYKGKCSEYCPLECDSLSYSISLSSINGVNTGFDLYFFDTRYTVISQKPKMEAFDLVSNLGGILGLFIGISFLSFVELIEILIEIFYIQFID